MEEREQPLFGRRVLVTRAAGQASELADRLQRAGAIPILIPTIEIGPPSSFGAFDAALSALDGFDMVTFTSSNAVEAFAERSRALQIRAVPRGIAVVGSATAKAVEAIGLRVDVIPEKFTAEALAETLRPTAAGRRYLLLLAQNAPTTLPDALEAAGAKATVVPAYRNRVPVASVRAVRDLFASEASAPDAVTFTSASTATNLLGLLTEAKLQLPGAVIRASIGPVTSKTLSSLGIPPHVEASESNIAGLVEALAAYFARRH